MAWKAGTGSEEILSARMACRGSLRIGQLLAHGSELQGVFDMGQKALAEPAPCRSQCLISFALFPGLASWMQNTLSLGSSRTLEGFVPPQPGSSRARSGIDWSSGGLAREEGNFRVLLACHGLLNPPPPS